MNPVFTFVLGLLIGWLIEWLIDYFYWRRRPAGAPVVEPASMGESDSRAALRARVKGGTEGEVRDDLKVIKGIGTVIERKLNEAGVYTFEQLGNLTVAQLRRILGSSIERLANEESLLQQARDLARRK